MTLPLFKNFVDVIVLNHVTDYQQCQQQIELFFSSGGKKVQNGKFQAWKKRSKQVVLQVRYCL